MQIVLASHNRGKLQELQRILGDSLPGIDLVGYDGPEPRETGVTFEENSLLKARAAAAHTGLPAIADDSGISVDVLGGSPGIFSARWSGKKDDEANLSLLLAQLSDISDPHRSAGFVCAASLVTPEGEETVRVGSWRGQILDKARGEGGFGYDPIFQPEGETRSAAELTAAEKDTLSHRTRAFMMLAPEILKLKQL